MDLWEEGSREGGFRQLEDGSGGGVPAPVFTRAGSTWEQRREGWVPVPRLHGAGSRREDKVGKGDKISRLRCAVLGMICVRWGKRMGMDFRRGGNNGGKDGSPHAETFA